MTSSFAPKVPRTLVQQRRHNYDFIPLHLTSSSFSSPLFRSANHRSSSYSSHSSQVINVNMNMNIPPVHAAPAPAPVAAVMLEFGGSDTTTDDDKYSKELEVAVKAVHMACLLCHKVQRLFSDGLPVDHVPLKHNTSPVTVADWSVQATISWVLSEGLGMENVSIVAEEDVEELLMASGSSNLVENVVKTVNECLGNIAPALLGLKSPAPALDEKLVLAAISRCNSIGACRAQQISGRFWVLDPVDGGTLGFLRGRGDQYTISLALIEDGKPVVGVLGCPNYPLVKKEGLSCYQNELIMSSSPTLISDHQHHHCAKGSVLYARKGSGAWMQPLLLVQGEEMFEMAYDSVGKRIKIKASSIKDPALATICGPVEKAVNSSHSFSTGLAHSSVGLSKVKYAAIAQGDAEIFMKFGRGGYKEKIWDHAAGVVISEEAGGVVSDAGGKPLDFSKGIYLEGVDRGIIGCSGSVLHEKILDAVDASWSSSSL